MEPLISPWFFYLLFLVDSLKSFGVLILAIYIIISVFVYMIMHDLKIDKVEDDEQKYKAHEELIRKLKKLVYKALIISFVLLITPNQKTLITMYVAEHVTPNNIQKAKEVIYEARDELIKTIKDLKEGSETAPDARSDWR